MASGGNTAQARADRAEQPTTIEGDRQDGTDTNLAYQGNVVLQRGDQYLNADNLSFDQENNTYVADGNVRYQDGGMRIIAKRAHGDQSKDTHEIEDLRYQLVSRRGNGGADSIDMSGAMGSLHGSTYSTCDPDQRAWELTARRIDVDTDEGWGTARGATIRIGRVPVLYVPVSYTHLDVYKRQYLTSTAIYVGLATIVHVGVLQVARLRASASSTN